MKPILLILASSLSLIAADLGVITPRTAIQLSHETSRRDFASFIVELMPSGSSNPPVTLTLTNDLLRVEEMPQMPSGRVTMGVRSKFTDGSQSKVQLYTFDLRRGDPPAPSAMPVAVPTPSEEENSLTNEIRKIREASSAPPPPAPASADFIVPMTNQMMFFRALTVDATATNEPVSGLITVYDKSYSVQANADRFVLSVPAELGLSGVIEMIQSHTGSNVVFVPRPMPGAKNQTYAEYLDWLEDRKGKRRNE